MSLGYLGKVRYACPHSGSDQSRALRSPLEVHVSVPAAKRPVPPRISLLDPRESSERIAQQWRDLQERSQPAGDPLPELRLRALFVSDLHLGMNQNARRALCQLIERYPAQRLYLVGDIVDAWLLPRRWSWDQDADAALASFATFLSRGGQIFQVPGNHDNYLRKHSPMSVGGWHLAESFIHECQGGETALVLHGDQFDPFSGRYSWLARLGARIYGRLQRRMAPLDGKDQPEKGLAWTAKRATKVLVQWICASEQRACARAKEEAADTVISGHTHHPKDHRRFGQRYLNTGDWIDSCTCAAETLDGRLVLCRWQQTEQRLVSWAKGEPL